MPEDVERKGHRNPATRAAIIEKLVQKGFVERKGGQEGQGAGPYGQGPRPGRRSAGTDTVPSMTAEWEEKPLGIEEGRLCA